MAARFTTPFLLYSYPWMPFPRVIGIYLKERGIPSSLVTVVHVSDPQSGDSVVDQSLSVPPRPKGSLPILVIPQATGPEVHIRQCPAILNFLEELSKTGTVGFPKPTTSMLGVDILERARIQEVRTLAEECLVNWNPIRTFGSGAGSMRCPEAAREMIPWCLRPLAAIEKLLADDPRDLSELKTGGSAGVTVADIVLFQFLEFVRTCYNIDVISVEMEQKLGKDTYGRSQDVSFDHLRMFYAAMSTRPSVARDMPGEVVPQSALGYMQTWYDGVWN